MNIRRLCLLPGEIGCHASLTHQGVLSKNWVWATRLIDARCQIRGALASVIVQVVLSEPLRLWPWRSHKSAVTGRGKHLYKSTRTVTQTSPAAQTHLSISVCLPQGLSDQLFSRSLSLSASACISRLYFITKLQPVDGLTIHRFILKRILHFQPTSRTDTFTSIFIHYTTWL